MFQIIGFFVITFITIFVLLLGIGGFICTSNLSNSRHTKYKELKTRKELNECTAG